MKNPKILYVLLMSVLGCGWLLNGCNSSDSPTIPSTGTHGVLINACSLLTSAEAEAILGKPVLLVKSDTSYGYMTHCSYVGSINSGFVIPSHVDIVVFTTAGIQSHPPNNPLTVPTFFASLKTGTALTDQLQLNGIGTDAIWLKKPGKLSFYKADVQVDVLYRPNGTPVVDTSVAAFEGSKTTALRVAEKI